MKILRVAAYCAAVLILLGASNAPQVTVPQSQIDAENARWRSFGVTLPKGGIVLHAPYGAPYSNRSFVVPYAWYQRFYQESRSAGSYRVKASDLRADLPTLRLLMEKTYAGYGIAQERGWNWKSWFGDWDARLARSGDSALQLRTAFAPWERLQQFQPDGDSGIPNVKLFTQGSQSAVLGSAPNAPCTTLRTSEGRTFALSSRDAAQQPHAVQVWNGKRLTAGWYVSYPRVDGTASSLRCGARTITLAAIGASKNIAPKPAYEPLGDGIAYVRLPSFTDANDEALRQALSRAQGLGRERLVIFDLRGNAGGSAPADLLTNWFAESAVEIAGSAPTQFGTQSCFRTALQFGLSQQLVSSLKSPVSGQLQRQIQAIVDEVGTTQPDACAVQQSVTRGDGDLRDHRFTVAPPDPGATRILAIVDEGCTQDCEYLTALLARLPGSVIAGSSTHGVLQFTQAGYFVLPHSRIPFRLASARTDAYGDGRSVDGYGITVDVVLPTPQSQDRASLTALARALLPPS